MGGKDSKMTNQGSCSSLNPNERKRLTEFLEARGSNSQFNHQSMQTLWEDYLVPDLLKAYTDYLMKQEKRKKDFIGVEEFVIIYSFLIRGTAEEKAKTIGEIIGIHRNSSGQQTVTFHSLLKYLCDLLESYFKGLKSRKDENYVSWTHIKHPQRQIMEHVVEGVCCELQRKGDEVQISDLERWLNSCGVISVLHSYVLGSLYNLEPEVKATVIPRAILPTMKTHLMLDLSQVVYLNSFLPTQGKSKWTFLFASGTHGESFSKFVGCITNQGPILLVIQAHDGSVFGGYASSNLTLGPRWEGTEESFLFRLKPTVEVFSTTGYNNHYAYVNSNQASLPNGLGMGGQYNYWGLWIDSHFGDGECSDSCTTFKNYKMLCSKKKFHINSLEAWGVGQRPATAEELGERSILDKDTAAIHILEMAGHKTYSHGLREDSPPKDQ